MTSFPDTRASLIQSVKDPENQQAWEQFVAIYRPVIYRSAVAKGLQEADAQDLAQQVLAAVSTALGRWDNSKSGKPFRHWLRRIIHNAIVNALQRSGRDQAAGSASVQELLNELPSRDPGTEQIVQMEYRRELYLRAVDVVRRDVAPDSWQAFELTAVGGMSKSDAAARLGKSIGTIYAARSRVLKRIRDVVAELEEQQS